MGWGWGSETTLVSVQFISIFGENCHVRDKYVSYSSQHTQGLICVSNFVATSLPVLSSDSLSCDYTPPHDATYPCQWSESCSVMSHSLWPHGLYSAWDSPGQNTGVGSLSLFQGIFPTQGFSRGLPHCRRILYQLSHKGSPRILERVAYPFSSGSSRPKNWTGVSCVAGRFFTNRATWEAQLTILSWKPAEMEGWEMQPAGNSLLQIQSRVGFKRRTYLRQHALERLLTPHC